MNGTRRDGHAGSIPAGSILLSTMRVCDARGGNDSIEHVPEGVG